MSSLSSSTLVQPKIIADGIYLSTATEYQVHRVTVVLSREGLEIEHKMGRQSHSGENTKRQLSLIKTQVQQLFSFSERTGVVLLNSA